MRVIARKTLREFWEKHPETEGPLRCWYAIANNATWASHESIRTHIPTARSVGNRRVVFRIHGNDYRLVAAFRFDLQIAFVRFIGTHAEYDEIDATQV